MMDFPPSGTSSQIWGPYEITFPAPTGVFDAIKEMNISAALESGEKIDGAKIKKSAR